MEGGSSSLPRLLDIPLRNLFRYDYGTLDNLCSPDNRKATFWSAGRPEPDRLTRGTLEIDRDAGRSGEDRLWARVDRRVGCVHVGDADAVESHFTGARGRCCLCLGVVR